MIESASSTPGTPKLRTSREQLPAPRSSTGTSSAATYLNLVVPCRLTLAAQTAIRESAPDPVKLRRAPGGAWATSVRLAKTEERPSSVASCSVPAASTQRTKAEPLSGTTTYSQPACSVDQVCPEARGTMYKPVCCQPGRESSTTTSLPGRWALPIGRTQGESVAVIGPPGRPRGPAPLRRPRPPRRPRPAGRAGHGPPPDPAPTAGPGPCPRRRRCVRGRPVGLLRAAGSASWSPPSRGGGHRRQEVSATYVRCWLPGPRRCEWTGSCCRDPEGS